MLTDRDEQPLRLMGFSKPASYAIIQASGEIRTRNILVNGQTLFQLSYRSKYGKWRNRTTRQPTCLIYRPRFYRPLTGTLPTTEGKGVEPSCTMHGLAFKASCPPTSATLQQTPWAGVEPAVSEFVARGPIQLDYQGKKLATGFEPATRALQVLCSPS